MFYLKIYEEMVEVDDGDEVIMDAVEVDVEDMDYVPGSFLKSLMDLFILTKIVNSLKLS